MTSNVEVGGPLLPNAQTLAGISVGPGLFLIELNSFLLRFDAAGWTRAESLALLTNLGLRFLLGPSGRTYVLKAALEVAFTLLFTTGPCDQPYTHPQTATPASPEAKAALAKLLIYRSQEHAPTGPHSAESLASGLAHLADCVRRASEDTTGQLIAEIQNGWKRIGILSESESELEPPSPSHQNTASPTSVNPHP